MNKSELVQSLANRADIKKAEAQRVVDALFSADKGIIAKTLKKGERVQITGFGTFETRERKARMGRNPRTGQEIRIAKSKSPSFRAGKGFKESIK